MHWTSRSGRTRRRTARHGRAATAARSPSADCARRRARRWCWRRWRRGPAGPSPRSLRHGTRADPARGLPSGAKPTTAGESVDSPEFGGERPDPQARAGWRTATRCTATPGRCLPLGPRCLASASSVVLLCRSSSSSRKEPQRTQRTQSRANGGPAAGRPTTALRDGPARLPWRRLPGDGLGDGGRGEPGGGEEEALAHGTGRRCSDVVGLVPAGNASGRPRREVGDEAGRTGRARRPAVQRPSRRQRRHDGSAPRTAPGRVAISYYVAMH
jgi:hypothetical protein